MEDVASKAIERFEDLLRMVAPGFLCLFLFVVIDPAHGKSLEQVIGVADWRFVALAVLLGLLSYSLHFAVLESVFIWLAMIFLQRFDALVVDALHKRPAKVIDAARSLSGLSLAHDRWARRVSGDQGMRSIQSMLTRQYAYLHFLYCSAYLTIGLALYVHIDSPFDAQPSLAWWQVGLIGVALLVIAFIKDYLVTRHEIVLFGEFPELERKPTSSPVEKTAPAASPENPSETVS